jgi:hypothetical protein
VPMYMAIACFVLMLVFYPSRKIAPPAAAA